MVRIRISPEGVEVACDIISSFFAIWYWAEAHPKKKRKPNRIIPGSLTLGEMDFIDL
jgi:hypothetical protein